MARELPIPLEPNAPDLGPGGFSGQTQGMRGLIAAGIALILGGACTGSQVVLVGEGVRPAPLVPELELRITDAAGFPIAGAVVTVGESPLALDQGGMGRVAWTGAPILVQASAPGFVTASLRLDNPPERLRAGLALQDTVLTGEARTADGRPLPGTTIQLGEASAVTDAAGGFRLSRVVAGELKAWRPAWSPTVVAWDGVVPSVQAVLEPRTARALHANLAAPAFPDTWKRLLSLAEATEINAMVIDLKDESGRIWYQSQVPLATEVGAVEPRYSLPDTIAALDSRGIYVIGRIVTFQDPVAARARTDLAIWDTSRDRLYRQDQQYFLDPTDPGAQRYALDLAVEACGTGVDEIQFDYVRFPDGFGPGARFDGGAVYIGANDDPVAAPARIGAIASFLAEARGLLNPMGCAVAADIFAYVMRVPNDQGIGQRPEELAQVVDVLSPMIYPDHYSEGNFGFADPADYPGQVVAAALDEGIPRVAGSVVVIRPWVADFGYSANSVRAEIDSAEARGVGWMLWNANSNHSEGALLPE